MPRLPDTKSDYVPNTQIGSPIFHVLTLVFVLVSAFATVYLVKEALTLHFLLKDQAIIVFSILSGVVAGGFAYLSRRFFAAILTSFIVLGILSYLFFLLWKIL